MLRFGINSETLNDLDFLGRGIDVSRDREEKRGHTCIHTYMTRARFETASDRRSRDHYDISF